MFVLLSINLIRSKLEIFVMSIIIIMKTSRHVRTKLFVMSRMSPLLDQNPVLA